MIQYKYLKDQAGKTPYDVACNNDDADKSQRNTIRELLKWQKFSIKTYIKEINYFRFDRNISKRY